MEVRVRVPEFVQIPIVLALLAAVVATSGCKSTTPAPTKDESKVTITMSTAEPVSQGAHIDSVAFAVPASRRGVFIFSKTAGFRHDSIPEGIDCLKRICHSERLDPDATEDASKFTDEILKAYDVVVFLNTTGDVLNEDQQDAMERFVRRGGGFVGIHAAADTEYDWEWYGVMIGAYFKSHPAIQQAHVVVLDKDHPATSHLPSRWTRTDEWYDFKATPREGLRWLLRVDEATYQGATMGQDHPIAWCHEFDGGRAFYTGLGHTKESYAEPLFVEHLRGAIRWAARLDAKPAETTLQSMPQTTPQTTPETRAD